MPNEKKQRNHDDLCDISFRSRSTFASGIKSSAMFLYIRQQHMGTALGVEKEKENQKLIAIENQIRERKLGQN